jgi:uncharacterized membrane protein YfcA
MEFPVAITSLAVLSGFVVGLLVGLTGVGGGSLMTPILILLFGTHASTAVGTDLLYAAATKSAGSIAHGPGKTVDWSITLRLAAGSLPGVILTIIGPYLVGIRGDNSSPLITITLGLALLLSAAAVLVRQKIMTCSILQSAAASRRTVPLTVMAGLALGVLMTISSVGAGALGMVMLVSLYPTKPLARLVGTDIAHAVPLTLVAGLGHWLLGSVDWVLMLSLLLGSVPGIVLGSNLSGRLPEWLLQPILTAVLIIVGIRMRSR